MQNLNLKIGKRKLMFFHLGNFIVIKDEARHSVILKIKNSSKKFYLLGVETNRTKSGRIEVINVLPDPLRSNRNEKYFESRSLDSIWNEPGIYIFSSTGSKKYRYIGRSSVAMIKRLRGYLAPGHTQTTNVFVNQSIYKALSGGFHVHIFFFPERDLEKDLQKFLLPDWNRE